MSERMGCLRFTSDILWGRINKVDNFVRHWTPQDRQKLAGIRVGCLCQLVRGWWKPGQIGRSKARFGFHPAAHRAMPDTDAGRQFFWARVCWSMAAIQQRYAQEGRPHRRSGDVPGLSEEDLPGASAPQSGGRGGRRSHGPGPVPQAQARHRAARSQSTGPRRPFHFG